MRLLPCVSQAKAIAKVMTIVWLFSLAVSVANACVLWENRTDAGLRDRSGGSQSLHGAKHTVVGEQVAGVAAAHETEVPNSGQQACKSFCDAEQSTVAKAKTPDPSDAPPLLVATGTSWTKSAARAEGAWQVAAAPPPRIAAAILFLRLTL